MYEWTSPDGVWNIHSYDRWKIENMRTGFCDNPIVYDSGKVAFDYPELVPEYVKDRFRDLVKVAGAVDALDEQHTLQPLHDTSARREALKKVYARIIAQLQGDPFERLIFVQCFAALDASEGHCLVGEYIDEFNRTLIEYQEAMGHDVD